MLLVLCVWDGRGAAQDLFYDAYDRGVRAFNNGDLATAKRMFERALDIDGRQARQKRFVGMRFGVYLPEYYLARISLKEKRYDAAVEYFNRLERAGLIKQGDAEYVTLVGERTQAERERAALTAAAASSPSRPTAESGTSPPTGQIVTADQARVSASNQTPPTVPEVATAPAGSVARDGSQGSVPLVTGDGRSAGVPPPDAGRPGAPTGAASSNNVATTSPSTRVPEAPSGQVEMRRLLGEAERSLLARNFAAAASAVGGIQSLPGGREAAASIVRSLTDQLIRAGELQLREGNVSGARSSLALLDRVAPDSSSSRELRRRIDAQTALTLVERDSLRALLLGEYQRAIELTASNLPQQGGSPRLLLYAAMGRAGLALTAEADRRPRLLAEARSIFAQARTAGGAVTTERAFISPEILAVLESSR